jgi:hypothetical protein
MLTKLLKSTTMHNITLTQTFVNIAISLALELVDFVESAYTTCAKLSYSKEVKYKIVYKCKWQN